MPITSMVSPSRWTARPQDGTPSCWRDRCSKAAAGPAELCASHRDEMRSWTTTVPRPSDGRPAVARWLDDLEVQLDQAIRSTA